MGVIMKKMVSILIIIIFLTSLVGATRLNDTLDQKTYDVLLSNNHPDEWIKTYGQRNLTEYSYRFIQTADEGYLIVGVQKQNMRSYDIYLIKTNKEGNEEWNSTYCESETEVGYDVKQTSDGGYIIAGSTSRYVEEYYADAWIIKIDEMGNEEWNHTYGGPDDDRAYSILETEEGDFVFCGMKDSKYYYQGGDAWLVKTSKSGELLWEKTFNKTLYMDYGFSLQQTLDGGYILGGTCNYSVGSQEAKADFYLLKTDSEGNKLWDESYGDKSHTETNIALDLTADGGYIMAGWGGQGRCYMVKTDAEGKVKWQKYFKEEGYDYWIRSIIQTADGGYLLSGQYGNESFGNTCYGILTLKTDAEGNTEWNRKFLQVIPYFSFSYCCIQLPDESYVVSGSSVYFISNKTNRPDIILLNIVDIPPDKPDTPIGSSEGKIGVEYTYSAETTDCDNDQIHYMFEWGDGNNSGWLGPYESGELCETSHIWDEKDTYDVRVKAKDEYGVESLWSDPLPVTMPRDLNSLLRFWFGVVFNWFDNFNSFSFFSR